MPSVSITNMAQLLATTLLIIIVSSVLSVSKAHAEIRPLTRSVSSLNTDPGYPHHYPDTQFLLDFGEGLLRIGEAGKIVSGVAASWSIDIPTQRITFKLKQDRKWSDGKPVIANDFIKAWKRNYIINGNNTFSNIFTRIKGAKAFQKSPEKNAELLGLHAPDPYTLEITFSKLDQLFPLRSYNAAFHPVPSHFIEKIGEPAWLTHPGRPYNGAYTIRPTHIDQKEDVNYTILEPNELHPDYQKIDIKKLRYNETGHINNTTGTDQLTQPTKVDISYIRAGNLQTKSSKLFLKSLGYRLEKNPSLRTDYMLINLKKIKEPDLINLIKYAVLQEDIASRNSFENYKPIKSFFRPGDKLTSIENNFYIEKTHRIKKASILSKKSGLTYKNPIKLKMITVDSKKRTYKTIEQLLRNYNLQVETKTVPKWPDLMLELSKGDSYDLLVGGWLPALPDPSTSFILFERPYIRDWLTHDQDRMELDELLSAARAQTGKKRLKLYKQAEELLINKGGVVPLITTDSHTVVSDRVCNWHHSTNILHPSMWLKWCN